MAVTDTPYTGVPELDGQHVMQIRLLLAVEKGLEGANRTVALELLSRLDTFTVMHFESEQTLMRLYGYSGCEEHELEHARLLEELRRLTKRVASEDTQVLPVAAAAIRSWLNNHMQTFDRAFGAFVRELAQGSGAAR
jgi:hemerythrin